MAPRQAATTQLGLERALKAASKAGLKAEKLELTSDGAVIHFASGDRSEVKPPSPPPDPDHNEWDDVK
ncbi:hypothetical protein A5906_26340 [Bradyrhizobium sacchari]|uniref:Uncharacterized protein n=1 Tax=Bradyrhizobium sacchari TaxID=1399419 RepID=A0A560JYV0_9BRAD|nr:hypothetical protein [Bradyrhizobium sacchari]OPY99249.1 hypothetical protein A5906_26340 [Bradyrhizobium sacchari]TWB62944.1 hypothetical protein FBZ94_103644 [Bradyrhizobium sacchari]TWB76126.1 hypothetical protein FBZ95_104306 [Bradyrhizobium sacchari]